MLTLTVAAGTYVHLKNHIAAHSAHSLTQAHNPYSPTAVDGIPTH
jgi:hypothetical protein